MARTPDGVRGMRILALSVAAGLALAWVIGAATGRFEHDRYESAFGGPWRAGAHPPGSAIGSPFWGRNLGWRQDLAGNIHTVRA